MGEGLLRKKNTFLRSERCEFACLGEGRSQASNLRSEKMAEKSTLASPGRSSFPCLFGKRHGKPPKNKDLLCLPNPQNPWERREKPFKIARNFLENQISAWTSVATIHFSRGKLFYLQLELLCLQLSFFAYSPLRPLLDALSHCKQKKLQL